MNKARIFFACLVLLIGACEKPPAREESVLPPAQEGGIFILNEGTFNNGNASLTFYDFKNKTLTDDVFFAANNRHVGDVLQSLTIHNGLAYMVVNNSKKVEVIDAGSFMSKGIISGFNSPRYIAVTDNGKGYVSDLYDNHIAVVDLASKSIINKIPCAGATEQLLRYSDKVFVCNTLKNAVYVIDVTTDKITDTITVAYGPNSLLLDHYNKLWVLCSGDKSKGWSAGLFRIDPATLVIERSFPNMAPEGIFGATRLCTNGSKDKLFWLNSDLFSLKISDTIISASSFIPASGKTFYGLGVDPVTGELFVSDAIDFVQRSNIYKYNSAGEPRGIFKGGINTSSFYFYYK